MLDVANIFRTEKSLEDSLIRSNNTANQSEILNNTHSNIQCDRSRIACKSPSCIGLKGPHTTSSDGKGHLRAAKDVSLHAITHPWLRELAPVSCGNGNSLPLDKMSRLINSKKRFHSLDKYFNQ
ncbi:hypothetical protein ACJJTC_005338 [Scirpophaga incertulas]